MLKSVSTCLSCKNLVENFRCKVHQLEVELNNVCDSHLSKPSLNKGLLAIIVLTIKPIIALTPTRQVKGFYVLIGKFNSFNILYFVKFLVI